MTTIIKHTKSKEKCRFFSGPSLFVISLAITFYFLFSLIIQAGEKTLKASKSRVEKACKDYEGFYYETPKGAYGCVIENKDGEITATLDCKASGDCLGWSDDLSIPPGNRKPFSDFHALVKIFQGHLKSNPNKATYQNNKSNSQESDLIKKSSMLINEGEYLIHKNKQKLMKSKKEAIKDLKRLIWISSKLRRNKNIILKTK